MNSERFVLYVISAITLGLALGIAGGLTLGVWGQLVGVLTALVLASPVALAWQGLRHSAATGTLTATARA